MGQIERINICWDCQFCELDKRRNLICTYTKEEPNSKTGCPYYVISDPRADLVRRKFLLIKENVCSMFLVWLSISLIISILLKSYPSEGFGMALLREFGRIALETLLCCFIYKRKIGALIIAGLVWLTYFGVCCINVVLTLNSLYGLIYAAEMALHGFAIYYCFFNKNFLFFFNKLPARHS